MRTWRTRPERKWVRFPGPWTLTCFMMMLWVLFLTSRNDEERAWVDKPDYAGRTMRREGTVAGRFLRDML